MTHRVVHEFTEDEFAVLSELQGKVVETIGLILRLHRIRFDPQVQVVDWTSKSVKEVVNE